MSGSGTKQDGPTAGRLRRAVGAVLGTLVSLGMPTVAVATSFTEVTVEDLARASDLVIVGRVEHLEVLPAGPAGQPGIHTRAVIQVSEVLRASGAIEPRTMIEVWVHGGRLGSRMRVVPGQATFSSGEDVALSSSRPAGASGQPAWGEVSGSRPGRRTDASSQRSAMTFACSLHEVWPLPNSGLVSRARIPDGAREAQIRRTRNCGGFARSGPIARIPHALR